MQSRIKEMCHRSGISMAELARRIVVDKSTMTRWNKDIGTVQLMFLEAMSQVLECDIQDLYDNPIIFEAS